MSKKKTKAGIRKCSAALRQCSRAISETRTGRRFRRAPPAGADCRVLWAISASVNQRNSGAKVAAWSLPWLIAQSLPVQPGGRGPPVSTVRRSLPRPARQIGGAVVAEIVHQHDMERTGIILRQQAADAVLDHIGLVAGRHHRHHGRPCGRLGDRRGVALAQQPEAAMQKQQIKPDRQRHKAEQDARDHCRYPFSRNQASASFRPSL